MMQDLHRIETTLWKRPELQFTDGQAHAEARDYHGCTFALGNVRVIYRKSKITPRKTGQFVTLWKRAQDGTTQPFGATDDFACCIIAVEQNEKFGVFVFPKSVLAKHGILSSDRKPGKRGFRLYSDFDVTLNKQAQSTRNWQKDFFINFDDLDHAHQKFKTIFDRVTECLST